MNPLIHGDYRPQEPKSYQAKPLESDVNKRIKHIAKEFNPVSNPAKRLMNKITQWVRNDTAEMKETKKIQNSFDAILNYLNDLEGRIDMHAASIYKFDTDDLQNFQAIERYMSHHIHAKGGEFSKKIGDIGYKMDQLRLRAELRNDSIRTRKTMPFMHAMKDVYGFDVSNFDHKKLADLKVLLKKAYDTLEPLSKEHAMLAASAANTLRNYILKLEIKTNQNLRDELKDLDKYAKGIIGDLPEVNLYSKNVEEVTKIIDILTKAVDAVKKIDNPELKRLVAGQLFEYAFKLKENIDKDEKFKQSVDQPSQAYNKLNNAEFTLRDIIDS